MESTVETVIKIILAVLVALAVLACFILPRSRLLKKGRMTERAYNATSIIGIICGVAGLVVTLVWPQDIIELHLWELIVLPFAVMHFYWAAVIQSRKTVEIVDEKQSFDLTKAAAVTWAFSIPPMVLIFILYSKGIFSGLMWFPYFLFVTLTIYSFSSILFYKRA